MANEHGTSAGPARRAPHPARAPCLVVGSVLLVLAVLFVGVPTLSQVAVKSSTVRQHYDEVPRRIDVRVDDGVTVEGADTDTVQADYRLRWSWGEPPIRHRMEDGVLTVRVDCAGTPCGAEATLRVPRRTAVRAKVDNVGEVAVTEVRGGVDVRGDTGAVTLSDVAGPVSVRARSGAVAGYRMASDEVEMVSRSGGIFASFTTPPTSVRARSRVGGIELQLPRIVERYRIDTASEYGMEEVQVPTDPNADRSIVAETRHGDIRVGQRGG